CERKGLPGGRRQGREAAADRLAHALRHRKPPRARVLVPLERSLGNEQAHDLVDEEGIALGLPMDGTDEHRRRAPADRLLEEAPHLLLPEAAQRHVVAVAAERAQDLGHGRGLPDLHFPVRAEEENPNVAQLVREELQEKERRRIGPLQVVEHEGERAPALPAPSPEGDAAARGRLPSELLREPGLPDARFADDEEEAPPPADGVLQARAQLRELTLPTHEDRSGVHLGGSLRRQRGFCQLTRVSFSRPVASYGGKRRKARERGYG